MITGDYARDRIKLLLLGTVLTGEVTSFETVRGGDNFGPYRSGPDVGTATINLYYAPGMTIPTIHLLVGNPVDIQLLDSTGAQLGTIFKGTLQDFSINYVISSTSGTFGQSLTLYVTDMVAMMQAIRVPGIVTSATTKNVTWESRVNSLGALLPAGYYNPIPTTPENHIFRLVDNNLDASLVDHLNLACNSVGATWLPVNESLLVLPKGDYPRTGLMFTDEPGYWFAGNIPYNAGTPTWDNIEYSELEIASDSANIANVADITNYIPRNMITSGTGVLRYKDPATTPGPNLETLKQPFTISDSVSVSTYGTRRRQIETNVYPYLTTDTEAYFVRINAAEDPGNEYQNRPTVQVVGTSANATVSNVTPRTGSYCTNITIATAVQSFGIYCGPSSGFPIKSRPTENTNPFQFYFRTSIAKARYRKGISYLDSSGNVLTTQFGSLITPTVNVYGTDTTVFMNYTTIPAGAVAWRPYFNIESSDGTNFAVGNVFKIDDLSINPVIDTAAIFSGDNADTDQNLFSWEGAPGASYSFVTRNVLDTVGAEILEYWATQNNAVRSITFNARQDWNTARYLHPGGRVDIRFQGTNYIAYINTARIRANADDFIVTLTLSSRPSSWN